MTSVTAARPAVRLLDDGGAAATADGEFFRSRTHLLAEGVTHSLLLSTPDARCALPLVVRPIPGTDRHDAVSPYGYPGGSLVGPPLAVSGADLAPTGLVSVFVRDRIGRPTLDGGTRRGTVLLHDPGRERRTGKSFRRDVRACTAAGYTVEVRRGADVDRDTLDRFARIYTDTMRRLGAADRYLFGSGYLVGCLAHDGAWLAVTRSPAGAVAAGELVVASDGLLHSYLAATCGEHRDAAPGKLATAALLDLADRLGTGLNHGGGLRPGDGLEAAKRRYCNTELPFLTHELVSDEDTYRELSGRAAGPADGFFPRYRRRPPPATAGVHPTPQETA